MIISRTPFRVSFAGGGTDLKEFYSKEYGAVLSTAIDKYIYITVNSLSYFYDHKIRISYSQTELVNDVDEIKHPVVKAALKLLKIEGGLEITSMADIPAKTGLGSSSSFTVGLLNALYAFQGKRVSQEMLAHEACEIEIEILKEPIGKQDQYIAAYGGINYIQFNKDESVFIEPVISSKEVTKEFSKNLMMFYTGITRDAKSVLGEQQKSTKDKFEELKKMRQLAIEIRDILNEGKNLDRIGEILDQEWRLKKSLTQSISNDVIDEYYDKALKAGALGGKLLGAGGGGFILLYVEPQNQERVRKALSDLKELSFDFESRGSTIIYFGG
ncbi:MAG: GHMP kinase [Thermodesulfobium sp.]